MLFLRYSFFHFLNISLLHLFMYFMFASVLLTLFQKRSDPIIGGWEPPCCFWELNSGHLEEQPVLLTFELTPAAPCDNF